MAELVKPLAEACAGIIEAVGLILIALFALYSLLFALYSLLKRVQGMTIFRETRHRLVRGILLGLDFLVAADIIHTVAVDLTFESVGVLASIVLVRTFLSFTLEVELTGRWPWQGKGDGSLTPQATGAGLVHDRASE